MLGFFLSYGKLPSEILNLFLCRNIEIMDTIFDDKSRKNLIFRIQNLSENDIALWGKMNVYQMIKHCSLWDEWMLGIKKPIYRQEFLGKIFGKMALRRMIKSDKFDKNVPTSSWLKIKEENGNFEEEKERWIFMVKQYDNYSNPQFVHDFFGKMTLEEIGILVFKHADHHLRQFGK